MKGSNLRVKDIGEFQLIERLTEVLGSTARGEGQGVIRGIGDDAAVLQYTPGTRLLATCDIMVEGKHFDLSYFTFSQVGKRALAVNLSDIAAMGGHPRWALVSLGIPPETEVKSVEEIYSGMAELAEEYGVNIIGGDTSSSAGNLVIDICLLGEAYRSEVTYRSGARDGDLILVTGALGSAAAGLACLKHKINISEIDGAEDVVRSHLTPTPRIKEASYIINNADVGALNDISDGLATELWEITQASGCGARIFEERLPISRATLNIAHSIGVDPLDWVLYGGEDFELLLTISGGKGTPLMLRKITRGLKRLTGTSLSAIGRIVPSGNEFIRRKGDAEELFPKGYNHFRPKNNTT